MKKIVIDLDGTLGRRVGAMELAVLRNDAAGALAVEHRRILRLRVHVTLVASDPELALAEHPPTLSVFAWARGLMHARASAPWKI